MAQVVEHVLGKDEVTSSNLVSSSIKKPECGSRSGFCLPAKPPARARERQTSVPQAQPFPTPKNSLKNCVFSVDFYKKAWYNSEGNMVYYPILLYAERIWKDMKKLSACLLALVMMVALCVPSFAGNAVNALTDVNAKEIGDKVDASQKAELETKINELKEALKGSSIETIKQKQDELQKVFYAVSEKLYQAQAAQQQAAGPDMGANPGASAQGGDPNVVDADFREVNDDNK